MYKLLLLLLLLGVQRLLALPVYAGEGNSLNFSASCPDATCRLWELRTDFIRPLGYEGQVEQLQELLLGNCHMRAMPVELLRLAPNLRSLLMQNCSLYHVNKEDFQATPQLRLLQLQRNHLTRLKEQQFVALQQLEVLQLGHNIIQYMHAQSFEGLQQLKLLGLQGNGIMQLSSGVFRSLPNLVHLDLSNNEIGNIDAGTFVQNGQLQTLLLNGNQLANFESNSLIALTNLRHLDLSNCGQLEELHLHGAQTLRLEGSGVQRLFIGSGGVIRLLAGRNALTQLRIADKGVVMEMDLHGNQLSDNETAPLLEGMWSLQRLDLSKNDLESLSLNSGNLSALSLQLPSLTHLNLAHNQLRLLPPNSALFPSHLLDLDISFNHMLLAREQNFEGLPNLRRLRMEGNCLREFNHELFHHNHPHIEEMGICDEESGYSLMRKMFIYLTDRGVHLPVPCAHKPPPRPQAEQEAVDASVVVGTESPQFQTRAGTGSIHPYWTTRDILAFITLLVVFIILLMQLYRILEEEGWLRRMGQWLRPRPPAVANGSRPRRLNEQDSEV